MNKISGNIVDHFVMKNHILLRIQLATLTVADLVRRWSTKYMYLHFRRWYYTLYRLSVSSIIRCIQILN